jgi:hypothetical protein
MVVPGSLAGREEGEDGADDQRGIRPDLPTLSIGGGREPLTEDQ